MFAFKRGKGRLKELCEFVDFLNIPVSIKVSFVEPRFVESD